MSVLQDHQPQDTFETETVQLLLDQQNANAMPEVGCVLPETSTTMKYSPVCSWCISTRDMVAWNRSFRNTPMIDLQNKLSLQPHVTWNKSCKSPRVRWWCWDFCCHEHEGGCSLLDFIQTGCILQATGELPL